MDYSDKERDLAIRIMLGEASDQGPNGLAGVANVMRNRVESGRFGDNLNTVLKTPYAFEPYMTRRREIMSYAPESQGYKTAGAVFDAVMKDDIDDNTGGATHFYSPTSQAAFGRQRPQWSRSTPTAAIGGHVFYAPEGKVDRTAATEDLLGGYAKDLDQPQAAAPAQSEDLLGGYAKALPAETPKAEQKPVEVTVKPMGQPTAPASEETPAQYVNRQMKEHQGDTIGDKAARASLSVLRGIGDVGDTIGHGITYLGEKGAQGLEKAGVISPETSKAVADWRASKNAAMEAESNAFDKTAEGSTIANVGRIGGQVLGSAPFLGAAGEVAMAPVNALTRVAPPIAQALAQPNLAVRAGQAVLGGAGIGAGTAALTSAASNEPVADQIGTGALTGAVAGPVARVAAGAGSKLVGGAIDAGTAALAKAGLDRGIPIGLGQVSENPAVRFATSFLKWVPFSGAGKLASQQQSALNREVAAEMGVSAEKVTPSVVKHAQEEAGKAYDSINARMGPMPVDSKFLGDLGSVKADAVDALEDTKAKVIGKHVDNILSKLKSGFTLTPENYQDILRHGGPLDVALNSTDSGIATHAQRIKGALEGLFERSNPALAAEKKATDYKYWVSKAVGDLAEKSPTGDISPDALLGKVAGSTTPINTVAKVAKRFLAEPRSSRTAEHEAVINVLQRLAGGAIGAGGVGAAAGFDPDSWQRDLLLGVGALGAGALGGRAVSAALRSPNLTNMAIRNALSQAQKVGNRSPLFLPSAAAAANRNSLAPTSP